MTDEYDNTNRGVLFINDRRTKPNHANFKGQCTVKTPDGELLEFWISGWEKKGRKGPFVSLAFELKEEQEEKDAPQTDQRSSFLGGGETASTSKEEPRERQSKQDLDDEIPF